VRIDHVIYATADLDAAAARIERELGLKARGGGRHDGLGTHNRIVPLGDGYLELLAVADRDEAAASPLGQAVLANLERVGDGLMGWAVEVEDVEPVARRLGVDVSRIGRQGLTAQLAGLETAMREPWLPFFIARDHGIQDPAGANGPGIGWIEVAGHAARLQDWLGDDSDIPVRIVDGEPGVNAVGIGDDKELRHA
jgi:catechol 2,3-dioxygenase-like lactoylglutathione lyase family enzyme